MQRCIYFKLIHAIPSTHKGINFKLFHVIPSFIGVFILNSFMISLSGRPWNLANPQECTCDKPWPKWGPPPWKFRFLHNCWMLDPKQMLLIFFQKLHLVFNIPILDDLFSLNQHRLAQKLELLNDWWLIDKKRIILTKRISNQKVGWVNCWVFGFLIDLIFKWLSFNYENTK